jgi:predicted dehydrogenase
MNVSRRVILGIGSGSILSSQSLTQGQYRAVIIGDSDRGGYGHGWDTAWHGVSSVIVTAIADPSEAGLRQALSRSPGARGYHDYRKMLEKEKPDIVTICPRWPDQRLAMFTAAAQAGAHVLVEKPFASSVREADAMVDSADRYDIKVQVGHTARIGGVAAGIRDVLREGRLGTLLEIRSRGKEDRRAGGEDLMVLGSHDFDLMRYYVGNPRWVFAHVTERGREVRPNMMRPASEPIGNVAGDQVAAMFCFPDDIHGYFSSKTSDDGTGKRFGVTFYGTKGMAFLSLTTEPCGPAYLLRSSSWVSDGQTPWERIDVASTPGLSPREAANRAMAINLVEAIEHSREPVCTARDGRWTIEMIEAIYQSQLSKTPIEFPLIKRS